MNAELSSCFDRLERRFALMRSLAGELEQAQRAVLASDLEAITWHTAQQQELCEALRALEMGDISGNGDLCRGRPDCLPENTVSAAVQQRWTVLCEELAEVERQVSHLNRVHATLLRGAQRTLAIFSRLLASSQVTYTAPTLGRQQPDSG
jgi:hypothetical protein